MSKCALPSGVSGLVGEVLEGTVWDNTVASVSNVVLSAVESGDGVGDVCFSKVSTSFLRSHLQHSPFFA